MFDEKRLSRTGTPPYVNVHYSLQEDGTPVCGYTSWAVYDNNPHHKTIDIFQQQDAVSLTMDEAAHLYDALGHFLALDYMDPGNLSETLNSSEDGNG